MESRLEEGLAHFHANHKFLSFYTFDSSSDVEAEESAVDTAWGDCVSAMMKLWLCDCM